MNKLALQSQVIINTRPKAQAQSLTTLLKQHGATVIEMSNHKTKLANPNTREATLAKRTFKLSAYHYR